MQPSCPTACSDWLLWNPPQIAPAEKATKRQRITLDGPPVLVRYLVLVLEKEVRTDKRRMRHTPRPQCLSSTCPNPAHRRVRSMLGPSLFGPTLDSRDVPGTSPGHPVIPPRPFNSFNRTHQRARLISDLSVLISQCSGTTRGSGHTSRLPDSSGLYPPPPPKNGRWRWSSIATPLPTPVRRCEICLRRGKPLVLLLHPPPPYLASALGFPCG